MHCTYITKSDPQRKEPNTYSETKLSQQHSILLKSNATTSSCWRLLVSEPNEVELQSSSWAALVSCGRGDLCWVKICNFYYLCVLILNENPLSSPSLLTSLPSLTPMHYTAILNLSCWQLIGVSSSFWCTHTYNTSSTMVKCVGCVKQYASVILIYMTFKNRISQRKIKARK